MKVKELLQIQICDLLLYNLDENNIISYSKEYDDYFVVQIFADLDADNKLHIFLDITSKEY